MSRIDVLGVGFDDLTMAQAVKAAEWYMDGRTAAFAVTPNPEIVMLSRENEALARAIDAAQLVLPDGIGVKLAAGILGTPIREKVAGIDFAGAVMSRLAARGGSVYLFGAKPGVADRAAGNLARRYPGLVISGAADGYFADDAPIIRDINEKSPDFLLVCLGAPKQELWMEKNAPVLSVGLMAGLGGSLDVFAGEAKRAPEFWRKINCEWLYRLLHDPRRIARVVKLPLFLLEAIEQRLKGGKNGR